MSRKKRREKPEGKWEQALIDETYDYRWREILDPLCEKFKRWEVGELTHRDMDGAIHETHKETQHLFSLFTQGRSYLVGLIQWDEEWFDGWLADHPPPEGIQLRARRGRSFSNEEETTPRKGGTEVG